MGFVLEKNALGSEVSRGWGGRCQGKGEQSSVGT